MNPNEAGIQLSISVETSGIRR